MTLWTGSSFDICLTHWSFQRPRLLSSLRVFFLSRTADKADIIMVSSFPHLAELSGLALLMVVLSLPHSAVHFSSQRVSVQAADFVYPDYHYDFFLLFFTPALSAVFLWLL